MKQIRFSALAAVGLLSSFSLLACGGADDANGRGTVASGNTAGQGEQKGEGSESATPGGAAGGEQGTGATPSEQGKSPGETAGLRCEFLDAFPEVASFPRGYVRQVATKGDINACPFIGSPNEQGGAKQAGGSAGQAGQPHAGEAGQPSAGASGHGSAGEAGQPSGGEAGQPGAGAAKPSLAADAHHAALVLIVNKGEISQSEIAIAKVTTAEAKSFAQRMIADHTAAIEREVELFSKAGLCPAPNELVRDVEQRSKQVEQQLTGAQGVDADKLYIRTQIEVHRMTLEGIEKMLLPSACRPELKQELEALRVTVSAHLQEAQRVQAALDKGTGQTGQTGQTGGERPSTGGGEQSPSQPGGEQSPTQQPSTGGGEQSPTQQPSTGGGEQSPTQQPSTGGEQSPTQQPSTGGEQSPTQSGGEQPKAECGETCDTGTKLP